MKIKVTLATLICLLLFTTNAWAGGRMELPWWANAVVLFICYSPLIFLLAINARAILGICSARFSLKPKLLVLATLANVIALVWCVHSISDDFCLFSQFDHHGYWYTPLSNLYSDSLRRDYADAVQDVWLKVFIIIVLVFLTWYYIRLGRQQRSQENAGDMEIE